VNFQVTVLKILVSYPDGFALMADLKRDMAILATSGRDWADRTRRMAARAPNLDIFSQRLVERLNGGWRITDDGRDVLEWMENRLKLDQPLEAAPPEPVMEAVSLMRQPANRAQWRLRRRERRRVARERVRAAS
jgi:hypothetical protein